MHTAGMIQGFGGREDTHSRDDPRFLEGGRIHTAGMIQGFRGRDTHSRDDPGFLPPSLPLKPWIISAVWGMTWDDPGF